ncbi:MAG TPA: FAD-dependent oxidoreductase [Stellaceae bacterium]|nr:FAD-dependent oxidoreductase [Stellaceae bacterium]
MSDTAPRYPYRPRADQRAPRPAQHPVIIVGAGPVGLALAIDLVLRGIPAVVLDEDDTVSVGSRSICWAKRTLEIYDRLGCAEPMMARGVTWNRGNVFHGDRLLYEFNLLPEEGHRFPAFINLQQNLAEEIFVARAETLAGDGLDLRWKNRVTNVVPADDHVRVDIDTPDGPYALRCDYLVAADGVRSTVRRVLGLDFKGRVFEDRFLISDVKMRAEFPPERRFWFDPTFHGGRSALLHRQADDVWRIDLQLGADADPELELQSERVVARLRRMLGPKIAFEVAWSSLYTFQCRRLERFRHGRVFFAGDAAHQVSPFGARGGNGGVQDADNLAWKLALVLKGAAPERLLDSYDAERIPAADENILHSTRATDFMTPKTAASAAFRDAALSLAERYPFARGFVNSGRLSRPATLDASPLNTPERDAFTPVLRPGSPAADAPIRTPQGGETSWLLRELRNGFTALCFGDDGAAASVGALANGPVPVAVKRIGPGALADPSGRAAQRYDARPGTLYLIRPDQHVAGRWRRPDADQIRSALERALALQE